MLDPETKQYIDEQIKQVLVVGTKKYGDTPTDALQLTPKKYVSSVVAANVPILGGPNGAIQFNNSSVLAGSAQLVWDNSSKFLEVLAGASFFQTGATNGSFTQVVGSTTTTNATPTNLSLFGVSSGQYGTVVEVYVFARRTGGSGGTVGDSAGYIRRGTYKNIAGTLSLVGAVQDGYTAEDNAAWDCTLAITGSNVAVQVTGDTNNNITWGVVARLHFTS